MIVPSYTDKQTLAELMEDWPAVKRKASKIGKKFMATMPKGRIGLDSEIVHGMAEMHRSKNNNLWHVNVYCVEGGKHFWSVTYVETERENGKKSYIYLRGMNTPHQYYVEIVPHTIRRLRERYECVDKDFDMRERELREILDHIVFDRHECGIFLRSGTFRDGKFEPYIDEDGNTHGKLLTKNCLFGARITPMGNFILRTFLNPVAPDGSLRKEFYNFFFAVYFTHNEPKLKDRALATDFLFKVVTEFPRMMSLLKSLFARIVPLYP